MGWFDNHNDDGLDDAALVRAARKRLLGELSGKAGSKAKKADAVQSIINNYGGGGVMDHLATRTPVGGEPGEDPYDYFVDISRKDLGINPETGKPIGWEKSVHRHRGDKKKA